MPSRSSVALVWNRWTTVTPAPARAKMDPTEDVVCPGCKVTLPPNPDICGECGYQFDGYLEDAGHG